MQNGQETERTVPRAEPHVASAHPAEQGGQHVTARVDIDFPLPEGKNIFDVMGSVMALKKTVAELGGSISGNLVLGRSKFPI